MRAGGVRGVAGVAAATVAALLGGAQVWAQPTPLAAAPHANERLRRIVREAEALGVRCGVDVRLLEAGAPARAALFERRARVTYTPASNMKILTAAHAALALGLDYEFQTRFALRGDDARPTLVVHASGDPTLSQLRLGDASPFAELARKLRAAGVREVAGIELQHGSWSGPSRPSTWPKSQLHKSYAAPTGPFVLEEGCCVIALTPTKHGQPVQVRSFPVGAALEIRGRVMTTRSHKVGATPIVSPTARGARLSSSMWSGFDTSFTRFADPAPEARYVAALRAALRAQGVRVDAARATTVEATRGPARAIWTMRSKIEWSLRRLLEDSSNFQAEQLTRVVAAARGARATLDEGRRRFAASCAKLEGSRGLVVEDASGLSRGNRISPRLVTAALERALLSSRAGTPFLELFPRSGINGTIARRMRSIRGRVRAKTGWIRGASSLSGVVLTSRDRVVLFSILMNYDAKRGGLNKRLKALQDRFVEALHGAY